MVHATSDTIFLVDDRDELAFVSDSVEELLGQRPADLLGVPAAQLVHPEDLAGSMAGVLPDVFVVRVRHADGSWRHLEMSSSPRGVGTSRSPSSCSTWTGSRRSTTPSGTVTATSCSPRSAAVRARAALPRPFLVEGLSLDVDVSIGVTVSTTGPTDMGSLLRQADVAMCTAKGRRSGIYDASSEALDRRVPAPR